jgi:hypothetical protein
MSSKNTIIWQIQNTTSPKAHYIHISILNG